eukprot:TRINITY_DN3665_c1_g3_i4.p3 TRINITY_DN3665_c1_g3~~TRINITY_DN3665_c1_g3_i4.p3  ORF type:complete len:114 (-),score=22.94 TRINITY_DN3665_c1_g3_i4:250-591(-)
MLVRHPTSDESWKERYREAAEITSWWPDDPKQTALYASRKGYKGVLHSSLNRLPVPKNSIVFSEVVANAFLQSAQHGQISTVKYLHKRYPQFTRNALLDRQDGIQLEINLKST